MSNPVLRITDGTTSINLIESSNGFRLKEWIPQLPSIKNGGVRHDSPFTPGKRLVHAVFDNVVETFVLSLSRCNQDEIADKMRTLYQMLEKSRNYWLNAAQEEFVWLVVRGSQETNLRYALIYDYSIAQENNPFSQPLFSSNPVMDDINLVLERGHWSSLEPGQDECLLVFSKNTHQTTGLNMGSFVDGTAASIVCPDLATGDYEKDVYVTNHHIYNQISDVAYRNSVTTAWSLKFTNGTETDPLPYPLLPSIFAVNDACYFGAREARTPFTSLVFYLAFGVGTMTVTWEYYNGSGWSTLDYRDNTEGMTETGQTSSIFWEMPTNWARCNVSSVVGGTGAPNFDAWWVRMRVTNSSGTPDQPFQNIRPIYTVINPYVEWDATEVTGDLPALANLRVRLRTPTESAQTPKFHTDRLYVAMRSLDRGSDFTPFVNINKTATVDTNNGVWNVYDYATYGAESQTMLGPTGYAMRYTPTGVATDNLIAYGYIADGYFDQYHGRYRMFIRCIQNGGSVGDISIKLTAGPFVTGEDIFVSEYVPVKYTGGPMQLLEMGVLQYPLVDGVSQSEVPYNFGFSLYGDNTNASNPTLDIYDLIFWPVDEWAGEFTYEQGAAGLTLIDRRFFYEIDSTRYPKREMRAHVKLVDWDYQRQELSYYYAPSLTAFSNRPLAIPPSKAMRMYFLSEEVQSAGGARDAAHEISHSVSMRQRNVFYGMRGAT